MRLALVTGGSKGLGLALCNQLRASGWAVVEYSRSAPHSFSVRVDLSSPESAHLTLAKSLGELAAAGCDELLAVSNAATLFPIGPVSRKAPSDVLANINTNVTSAILFLSQVTAHFQQLRCRKVLANISSGAALQGYAGWSLYCAAKAGLETYVQAVAAEQLREPYPFISVNLDPGVMDTDMQALIREASEADFPDVERFIRRKHDGGLASADDVASELLKTLSSVGLSAGERYDVGKTVRDRMT